MNYDELFYKCSQFLALASLDDELTKLDLPQNILDFVNNLSDPKHKGQVFSFLKKDNIKELSKVEEFYKDLLEKENKKNELKVSEVPEELKSVYDQLPSEKLKVYFLKLARSNKLPSDRNNLLEKFKTIDHFITENINKIGDISDLEFDKLYNTAKNWEDSFTNVKIEENVTLNPSNIVFKDWETPKYNGYFIYEITTKPEMQLEGKELNHCVGGDNHVNGMLSGTERIFSLRTSSNKPLVTIETSPDMYQFRQTFGYGNKEPSGEQMEMIGEWKNSVHPIDKILELTKSKNYQDKINAASFMNYNIPEYKGVIDVMIEEEKDSGISNLGSNAQNDPKDILQALANNTTLPLNYYYKIYDKCKNNLTTVYNILRNTKIDSNLFKTIYNEHKNNKTYVILTCSSINIKGEIDIITEIFKNYNNDESIMLSLLNNPSIDSNTCKHIINNLDKNTLSNILSDDNIKNFEGKFIDDLLSSNNIEVKNNIINLLVNNENYNNKVLKKFYKELGEVPILGNKEELLLDLIDSGNEELKKYIGIDYTKDKLSDSEFKYFVHKSYGSIFDDLAENPSLSQQQIQYLLDQDYESTNILLASNPSLSKEQIQYLLDKNNDNINYNLSQNPSLSKDQIQYLLNKNDYNINYNLAQNPSLSQEQLQHLLLDKNNDYINRKLAQNPSLSKDQIQYLLDKNDDYINRNLAKNPSLSKQHIEYLLDKNNDINRDLAQNPFLSKEHIQFLLNKNNDYINRKLAQNQSLSKDQIQYLLDKNDDYINWKLAQNSFLSQAQFQYLLDKNDDDINIYLARNPLLSKEQFQYLLDKNIYNINFYLAQNPSLSNEQFQHLLNKNDDDINYNLAKNTSLSKQQAIKLIKYKPKILRNYLNNAKTASKIDKLFKLSTKYYNITKNFNVN